MTYTHTVGVRNQYMEFSSPILDDNKAAGFIAKLDASGNPVVSPMSDLADVPAHEGGAHELVVVDVNGWAPTMDTVSVLVNDCSGALFDVDQTKMISTSGVGDQNDEALEMILAGDADVMYVYADQAYNKITACNDVLQDTTGQNCAIWDLLGKPNGYAYIHTGMTEYSVAGTTLSMSKIGTGVAAILNPCIEELIKTEDYYDICVKWDLEGSCYQNSFFPAGRRLGDAIYDLPTPSHTGGCGDGYCSCDA